MDPRRRAQRSIPLRLILMHDLRPPAEIDAAAFAKMPRTPAQHLRLALFGVIARVIESTLNRVAARPADSLEAILAAEAEARREAEEAVAALT